MALLLVAALHANPTVAGEITPPGTLPNPADLFFFESLDGGDFDYLTFEIGEVGNGSGTYLDIHTSRRMGGDLLDTKIGLYDASGRLMVTDDDGAVGPYSLLTFGDGMRELPDGAGKSAGDDGVLGRGTYTLVVGDAETNFAPDLADVSGGSSSGSYDLLVQAAYLVPEPGTALLLGLGLGGLAATRRRRGPTGGPAS